MKAQPAEHEVVAERGSAATGHPPHRRIEHHFLKSYLAHGSIAPSVAIATWRGDDLEVVSHTQGIYNLRDDLALVFGLPPGRVTVEHAEGAGCYGHNGADDVALDAALLARAVKGTPVRVQWSRADELSQAPMGAAMAIRVAAELDETGSILRWEHEIWGNGHVARPGRAPSPALLAGYDLAAPFPLLVAKDPALVAGGGGAQRNAVPLYDFPNWRIEKNRLTVMPLRTSSMRSLGAFGNVFAIESMMDEIARATGTDPLDLRLRYLADDRARDVISKAGAMAAWGRRPAEGRGIGLGFARYKNTAGYCAVVAEVDVSLDPRVEKLWMAVDVGEAINPDGVINQNEGGAIQAVSWTLKEAIRFSREDVESKSWETYPILGFSEVPEVEVALVSRPDDPPLGAGEAAHGPTAAAIGNAIASALGIRVTSLPLTRDTILQAMEA
jgi:CO/xanthine dehydrogenase Mo-binding subunit